MQNETVRTRFAPSPTGFMHVGNLRTALYEYLIAKSMGGQFVLRIEDTDQERLVEGAVDVIYRTLDQVGLKHDEGPDVGGDYGPYVQSKRKDLYKPYAEQLVREGKAYYCFCTKERLDALHEAQEGGVVHNHIHTAFKFYPRLFRVPPSGPSCDYGRRFGSAYHICLFQGGFLLSFLKTLEKGGRRVSAPVPGRHCSQCGA